MPAQLLYGKPVASAIEQSLKTFVQNQKKQGMRAPSLAVILIGDNPASSLYVAKKKKACESMGITFKLHHLPASSSEKTLKKLIDALNRQEAIDGMLVQMPLPAHLSQQVIIETIAPEKDADGFHPSNLGRLAQGFPAIQCPCTAAGVIKLLAHYNIALSSLHAVVVGASLIAGRPMAFELLNAKSTVTVCHSQTLNLEKHVRAADLLVSAAGKRHVIDPAWVKPETVVIDIGIHRSEEDKKLCGDLDFDTLVSKVRAITPVPGGVGPLTVAMLMTNVVHLFKLKFKLKLNLS